MTDRYWCEHAVVDGEVADGVSIDVDRGRIRTVAVDTSPAPGATRLGGVTVAGFANAHSHAFHRALRARTQAGRGSFWTWRDVMYRAAERLDPDSYHRLARAAYAEMACTGISCVGEFHYLHHQAGGVPYDDSNAMGAALLQAATEAGIRITLLDSLYLHGGLGRDGHLPPSGAQVRCSDGSAATWAERVESIPSTESSRIGAAVHSARAVDPGSIGVVADWARHRDAPVHAHVSEQVDENEQCREYFGCTPTALIEEAGALGTRFTAVHATHTSADDIDRLARSQSNVCLCPTTESDLGDGIGPAIGLTSAGIRLSLGSDSHAVIDPFVEMRSVELDGRLTSRERGLHRAIDLLAMGTDAGHAALGWDDAGSIAVGHRADLTTIDLDTMRTAGAPAELAVENLVFAATASDVTSVIVDGILVAEGGRHTRIDVATELEAAIRGLGL